MDISRRRLLGGLALLPVGLTVGVATADPAQARPRRRPNPVEKWRSFDDELAREAAAGKFTGMVLVARHGRLLLHRAYGMADAAGRVANTVDTRCVTGSITKTFTAVAVAQLVQRRGLDLHEPIGTYVPEFPQEIGGRVTPHHLLTHTSGMGDSMAGPAGDQPIELQEVLKRIIARPLLFEPGTRSQYSNDGFNVLGAIVQRLADRPFADHLRERVFAPAGMRDTALATFRAADLPRMAHGHMLVDANGRWLPPGPGQPPSDARLVQIGDRLINGLPAGNAYSTTADLLAFATALTRHQLLSPAMTKTLTTGTVPTGRPDERYAYGIDDRRLNGVRIVSKNGGSPGFLAQLDIFPDSGHVVAMLTNQDWVMLPAIRRAESILTTT